MLKTIVAVWTVAALAVVLAVTPVAAIQQNQADRQSSQDRNLDHVVLQLKWYHQFQFAGYYAALEQGYYADAGLDVEILEGKPEYTSADAVLDGRADYGVSGPEVLFNYLSGEPLVALAAIFQHSPTVLLVLEESGIKSPQDLVGKRVMNYEGFNGAECAAVLLKEGVSLEEVGFVDVSFDLSLLINGEVDSYLGYSTNEPYFLELQGISTVSLRPITYGIDFYGDTLFTGQDEMTRHPDRVRAFRQASIRGWEYAFDHEDELIDLIIEQYHCQKSRELLEFEAAEMRKLILPDLVEIGHMNPGRWQHIADTYVSLGMIDDSPPLGPFILEEHQLTDHPLFMRLAWGAGIAALVTLFISLMLLSFNQRLRRAVQARTAEMDQINRQLQRDIKERREIERALRASELNLSNIFDYALIGIAVMDREGNFTRINPRFAEILRYEQPELLTTGYFEIVHPGDRAIARANLAKLFEEELQDLSVERRFQRKDGAELTCDVLCRLLRDEEGGTGEILILINDITARKQAETALRESDKINRAIVENSPLGISVRGRTGRLLGCNQAWKNIWKLTDEAIEADMARERGSLNLDDSDLYLGRWLPAVRDIYVRGGTLAVPHVKVSRDRFQRPKWISQYYYAIMNEENAVDRVVILTEDITERMNAEEALRESERKLARAQEIAHIGHWEYSLATHHILWSDELYRIVGLKPGQLLPSVELVLDLVHPRDREKVSALLGGAPLGAGIQEVEYRIRHIDGTYRYIFDRVNISVDSDGRAEKVIGTAQDITTLKQAEEDLRRSREHLNQAQKMEAIGVLAGGIAHDFNNILLAILGNADMLLSDLSKDHPSSHFVEEIIIAGNRAAELVRQIMSFSRQSEQERAPVRVSRIVKEVTQLVRSTLPTNIEITANLGAPNAVIIADATEIHQVLLNLCANAGQAMLNTGGKLVVELDQVDIDEEFVQMHPLLNPGRHVLLTVTDTGPGIEGEVLEHIFEPFFTTKPVGKGTGMGLAVVHGIITSLNGMINVYSEIGKGTTFKIYLPAEKPTVEKTAQPSDTVAGGSERVLFIDDEPTIVRMGQRLLEKLGYQVTAVSSSTEALESFKRRPGDFDVVVTDQTMPAITGAELARAILEIRPDIPVILCTGFSHVIDAEESKRIGIREFLHKPFTRGTLDKAIRSVLDGRG